MILSHFQWRFLTSTCIYSEQDTEVLLVQLQKDQEAVEQVKEIVGQEEEVMKRETEIVHEYAEVYTLKLNLWYRTIVLIFLDFWKFTLKI